jgi:hypothetical protein
MSAAFNTSAQIHCCHDGLISHASDVGVGIDARNAVAMASAVNVA